MNEKHINVLINVCLLEVIIYMLIVRSNLQFIFSKKNFILALCEVNSTIYLVMLYLLNTILIPMRCVTVLLTHFCLGSTIEFVPSQQPGQPDQFIVRLPDGRWLFYQDCINICTVLRLKY